MFHQRVIASLRTLWWLALLVHAGSIVLFVSAVLGLVPWLGALPVAQIVVWAGTFAGWLPLVVLPMAIWVYRQRVLRQLDHADFAICVRCGYDLSRGDSFGPCPECGHHFAIDQQRTAWRRAGFDPDRKLGYPPPARSAGGLDTDARRRSGVRAVLPLVFASPRETPADTARINRDAALPSELGRSAGPRERGVTGGLQCSAPCFSSSASSSRRCWSRRASRHRSATRRWPHGSARSCS